MATAALIKELREKTGAGMVDCKNALNETNGDIEAAIKHLREKGLSALAKKSGRVAAEGLSNAFLVDGMGIIVEVNSETDFVGKNAEFVSFVEQVANQIAKSTANTAEELLTEKWHLDTNVSVEEALSQKIAVIGEKLSIRRFERYQSSNELVTYIHAGGKVAVMIELEGAKGDKVVEAGKNIAMQIAAMAPKFVTRDEVPADFIANEREILTKIALDEGKPANIVEKMIEGRLSKSLKDICLLDQEYVKDSSFTVGSYLESVSKEVGNSLSVKRFVRFATGEGIEKEETDFAAEVAAAMKG